MPPAERDEVRSIARAVVEAMTNDEDVMAALGSSEEVTPRDVRHAVERLCLELVRLDDERAGVARVFRTVRCACDVCVDEREAAMK